MSLVPSTIKITSPGKMMIKFNEPFTVVGGTDIQVQAVVFPPNSFRTGELKGIRVELVYKK